MFLIFIIWVPYMCVGVVKKDSFFGGVEHKIVHWMCIGNTGFLNKNINS